MTEWVLDRYYLAITAIVTVAYQLLFFFIAWTLQFDKVTDFAGGSNFTILAALTLGLSSTKYNSHARNIVASTLVMVYGLRLAGFLLFRILKTGKDERFNDLRSNFTSFLGFWIFQMIWVWTACLPLTLVNSYEVGYVHNKPPFGCATDVIGIVMWAVGMFFEAVSDIQKFRFRSANKDRSLFMKTGLFSISRHPNYFGDILMQFGIWVICISPAVRGFVFGGARVALYASVVGPLTVAFFLLFVSGIPLSERPVAKRRYENNQDYEGYERYVKRTSVLIPFPPSLYEKMPVILKRTLFLEFPMYVFDPAKHADREPEAVGGRGAQANDAEGDA